MPKFHRAEAVIEGALQSIRERSVWIRPTEMIRACSDPKDDMFLESANAARGRVCGDWQSQTPPRNRARDSDSYVRSAIALGQRDIVPNLIYHPCGDCDEQILDREAMRRIEAVSL